MKLLVAASMALVFVTASASIVSAAASREEFRGRWSRDCGGGRTCHLEIDDTKSPKTIQITFSIEGSGESCSWDVDAIYDKGFGGPVAQDPYGNYFFYLTLQNDDQLYSSGTMLSNCGPQPLDQHFARKPVFGGSAKDTMSSSDAEDDAQAAIGDRSVFDHNGSAVVIDPNAGTIVYRDPKKSISGMVKSGALLFEATRPWDPYDDDAVIKGTAYVFKRGCDPVPYKVSGRQKGWHTLILKGAAPIRQKDGCNVVGYKMNGNSILKFISWGD